MSLSLVLANALTGIRASSKQADQISNNIANALTEGYARRTVALSPANTGGMGAGVSVDGIIRAENPALAESSRFADAAAGEGDVLAEALNRLAEAVGDPGAPGSLAESADKLDAALSRAADTPENTGLLTDAARAAANEIASINRIATEAMALRTEADASIARQVSTINDTLTKIQSINIEIKSRNGAGQDVSALIDQRDALIRQVSSMIPVRVVNRDLGAVALVAKNGGQLLDGKVFPLGFEPTRVVTPGQTLANGALSGLTSNGQPVGVNDGVGLFDGGSLSAAFELRDDVVPEFTARLDAFAADLIARVQAPGVDPTLGATDAALFTDQGARFDPLNEEGVSLRIRLNASVDPSLNGDATLLRDGLAAAGPGDAGDATALVSLRDALGALTTATPGSGLTGSRSSAGFAAELSAATLSDSARLDQEAAFRVGRADELANAKLAELGVDTDQELSRLLLVEQTFNANARVVEVVDDLLERLSSL